MADVKDILGLGRDSAGADASREPAKKEKKELQQRPKGMSREAFNLLHGSHHIQQGDLMKDFVQKEEQKAATFTKTTYQLLPFQNEARRDKLRLRHWVQCYKDAAGQMRPVDDGPYPFAKFDVPVGAVKFDAIEYENVIRPKFPEADSGWSKEETEYLLDLCAQFDLRFVVVADRYRFPGSAGKARALEDLKARYYAIAAELAKARAGEALLAINQPLVKHPYDAQRERERRAALQLSLARTPLQAEEEDAVLAAAERIVDARKRAMSAARPGGAPLLHPESFSNDVGAAPFFDRAVTAVAPPAPGAYLRRGKLEEAKKQATNHSAQSGKALKLLDSVLADTAGVGVALPATCTRATMGAYLALFSESLHLVDLKQRTQLRGAGAGGKGLALGDEGRGKRQVKVKAPRESADMSPAPAPKRRR